MSVKVEIEDDVMIVRFPARSWEHVHDVVEQLKETPPSGYRLVESQVKPRGMHKSGRRCNARITFLSIDDRVAPFSPGGAIAFFEPYALMAQGVES
jgi:hypothetical protein